MNMRRKYCTWLNSYGMMGWNVGSTSSFKVGQEKDGRDGCKGKLKKPGMFSLYARKLIRNDSRVKNSPGEEGERTGKACLFCSNFMSRSHSTKNSFQFSSTMQLMKTYRFLCVHILTTGCLVTENVFTAILRRNPRLCQSHLVP